MSREFHERYSGSGVAPPSERSTGLVFAGAACVIAAIWHDTPKVLIPALVVAAVLTLASFLRPALLRPLNLVWFRFSLLLHKVVNPVVMFVMFAAVIVPAGLIMQLFRDPLRAKRDPKARSYWIDRDAALDATASMKDQF